MDPVAPWQALNKVYKSRDTCADLLNSIEEDCAIKEGKLARLKVNLAIFISLLFPCRLL